MSIFKQLEEANLSPQNILVLSDALDRRMNELFRESLEKMATFGNETGRLIKTISATSSSNPGIELAKALGIDLPDEVINKDKDPKVIVLDAKFSIIKEDAENIAEYFGENVKAKDGRFMSDISEEEGVDPSMIDYESVIDCFDIIIPKYNKFFNGCIDLMTDNKSIMVEQAREKLKDKEGSEETISELISNFDNLKISAEKSFSNLFEKTKLKLSDLNNVKSKIELIQEIL